MTAAVCLSISNPILPSVMDKPQHTSTPALEGPTSFSRVWRFTSNIYLCCLRMPLHVPFYSHALCNRIHDCEQTRFLRCISYAGWTIIFIISVLPLKQMNCHHGHGVFRSTLTFRHHITHLLYNWPLELPPIWSSAWMSAYPTPTHTHPFMCWTNSKHSPTHPMGYSHHSRSSLTSSSPIQQLCSWRIPWVPHSKWWNVDVFCYRPPHLHTDECL